MNNLLAILLAAADGGETAETVAKTPETWQLITQYVVYAVIIVVSILILMLLRKHTRLPRHGELKKKMQALLSDIRSIDVKSKRMDFIKSVSRTMYKADSLSYSAGMLAEKERYSDLGTISTLLSEARAELSPYKFGSKEAEEAEGLAAAAEKTEKALEVLEGIIQRDGELKGKRG